MKYDHGHRGPRARAIQLLSCPGYRREDHASVWSNAYADEILGYQTREHNRSCAHRVGHGFQETKNRLEK